MYCDLIFRTWKSTINGAVTSITPYEAGQAYWGGVNNDPMQTCKISATGCSSIYQTGATVKPESYAVKWFIKYSG